MVHSVIYYELNKNIISDIDFDKRSKELQRLQIQYPELSKKVQHFYKYFKDWDGGGGNKLPLKNEWAVAKARYMLELRGVFYGEGNNASSEV